MILFHRFNNLYLYVLVFVLILPTVAPCVVVPSIALAKNAASQNRAEPNKVVLDNFDATPDDNGNGVQLTWVTQREQNTNGFQVLRGTTTDFSTASAVTSNLITSQGENGGSYEYLDGTANTTTRYLYWLREEQDDGDIQFYGPVASLASAPSAITLADFSATFLDETGTVQIMWQTSSETNTQGFWILRSATGQQDDAVTINPEIIVGSSSQSGSYGYIDDSVVSELSYTYWIEETERDGLTNLYGPFAVTREDNSKLAIVIQDISSQSYRVLLPIIMH